MATAKQLHHDAMEILNERIENRTNPELMKKVEAKAFLLEKQAAELIPLGVEPTRSILFRSAGWMAANSEQYDEAQKMVDEGLKSAIHSEIIQELNELQEFITNKKQSL